MFCVIWCFFFEFYVANLCSLSVFCCLSFCIVYTEFFRPTWRINVLLYADSHCYLLLYWERLYLFFAVDLVWVADDIKAPAKSSNRIWQPSFQSVVTRCGDAVRNRPINGSVPVRRRVGNGADWFMWICHGYGRCGCRPNRQWRIRSVYNAQCRRSDIRQCHNCTAARWVGVWRPVAAWPAARHRRWTLHGSSCYKKIHSTNCLHACYRGRRRARPIPSFPCGRNEASHLSSVTHCTPPLSVRLSVVCLCLIEMPA